MLGVVGAILVLEEDGSNIACRYYGDYNSKTLKEKRAMALNVHNKTRGSHGDVALLDNMVVVYRTLSDAQIYVVGSLDENELQLAVVLSTIVEALSILFRSAVDHRKLLENYDYLLLVIDEVVDRGAVLECDPMLVAQRVAMRDKDSVVPLHEKTLSELIDSAKDQITDKIKKASEEMRRQGY